MFSTDQFADSQFTGTADGTDTDPFGLYGPVDLVDPTELYAGLAQSWTPTGRQQRQNIKDQHIAAYAEVLRLRQELLAAHIGGFMHCMAHVMQIMAMAYRIAALKEIILDQDRLIERTPWTTMVTLQIALLTGRRPEAIQQLVGCSNCTVISYDLGDPEASDYVQLDLVPSEYRIDVTPKGLTPLSIIADEYGNFSKVQVSQICGYLAMAGIPVDPDRVRAAFSEMNRNSTYVGLATV